MANVATGFRAGWVLVINVVSAIPLRAMSAGMTWLQHYRLQQFLKTSFWFWPFVVILITLFAALPAVDWLEAKGSRFAVPLAGSPCRKGKDYREQLFGVDADLSGLCTVVADHGRAVGQCSVDAANHGDHVLRHTGKDHDLYAFVLVSVWDSDTRSDRGWPRAPRWDQAFSHQRLDLRHPLPEVHPASRDESSANLPDAAYRGGRTICRRESLSEPVRHSSFGEGPIASRRS